MYYLATDTVPISTVNMPGFKHLLSALNPQYQLLPRNISLTRRYHSSIYMYMLEILLWCRHWKRLNFFQQQQIYGQVLPVSRTWHSQSILLTNMESPVILSSNGAYVCWPYWPEHCWCFVWHFDNCGLSTENLVAFITDSGSNVIAAFNFSGLLQISCFGHNLDLAIKKSPAISHVQQSLAQCLSLVELFHHSWKKTRDLRQNLQLLDLPQHKLKGDVATRWGLHMG